MVAMNDSQKPVMYQTFCVPSCTVPGVPLTPALDGEDTPPDHPLQDSLHPHLELAIVEGNFVHQVTEDKAHPRAIKGQYSDLARFPFSVGETRFSTACSAPPMISTGDLRVFGWDMIPNRLHDSGNIVIAVRDRCGGIYSEVS